MTPRKAYRARTCPYERKLARKVQGRLASLDLHRAVIRQNMDVLRLHPADEYRCDVARQNLCIYMRRYRSAVMDFAHWCGLDVVKEAA